MKKNKSKSGMLYQYSGGEGGVEMLIKVRKLTLKEQKNRITHHTEVYGHTFLTKDGEIVELRTVERNIEDDLFWGETYERIVLW
jgi:hypothetical protein